MKKNHVVEHFLRFFHRFTRFTKQQKVFVLYLFVLAFFLLVLPIIKIAPVNGEAHSIWLLNVHLLKVFLIVFACMAILFAWNMSFQFKNFVIGYFGFKENDALVNFGFLWIITTVFFSIGGTINVISVTTQTITTT
jgi:hypothetical protein